MERSGRPDDPAGSRAYPLRFIASAKHQAPSIASSAKRRLHSCSTASRTRR